MAQFRYLSINSSAKVLLLVGLHGDQIPKISDGDFVLRLEEQPAPLVDGVALVKTSGTGVVAFGGRQCPEERAAKFQLRNLLEAGFLPNNISLRSDNKRPGWYTLRVWLDCNKESTGKSFSDWGEAGSFAEEMVTAKWSVVTVYDNGDNWSVQMVGRKLDDRHVNYFGLVPKVIPVHGEHSGRDVASVKTPKSAGAESGRVITAPILSGAGGQPTVMELALQSAMRDKVGIASGDEVPNRTDSGNPARPEVWLKAALSRRQEGPKE